MSRSVSVVTNEGSDLSLEYDGYGRVAKKILTREGRTILTVEYAYRNPSETSTTGQIASITIGTNGASRSYSYTYDANGNILSVSDGSNTTSYAYDKAGQLLRENNQAAGKTWVWEYDDAGNILNKKEYAYTTGNLGAVLDTVEYQYNNDNWGDLLTAYDGNAITYDQIGNPLNDGTWEYTWEHGRQLASMTDGTITVDFQYNADGIRTRKTVSTASDHSHIFQTRVVAPTCTENGYTLHECSCGYSWQSNPVVATGHSFTTTEVEATCTAHGYTLMECECGYGYQEGSQGHTFTDTVVAPTAEENGYTLHSCECGYSYQDTPVASLGITNPTANGTAANTVVYDYVYNGSSLSYLTVTSTNFGAESVTEELYFGNGTVAYGDDVYYYVTNLQGDVVAIIDADGNVKVEYTYDAWGKILSISGPMADTLGAVNPLTYRGYVYDTETDLYYLQSRYYDPAVERFINADALVSTGQGFVGNNMFAYCGNKPVLLSDPSGLWGVSSYRNSAAASVYDPLLVPGVTQPELFPYATADDAARAFFEQIYSSSLYIRHEFSALIYSYTINGITRYNYSTPLSGEPHSVHLASGAIPGTTVVAYAHTHPNSIEFSDPDKEVATFREIDAYVVGPNLHYQRYNVSTDEVIDLGTITPNTLTNFQRFYLIIGFAASWYAHCTEGCKFGCKNKTWPTA